MRWLAAIALAACSAPATLGDLKDAESRADSGDVPGALAAYHRAQQSCRKLHPKRRRDSACADAMLGEGEVLDRANRHAEAVAVYLALPPKAPDDATLGATATYRAGDILLRDKDITAAWTALWRVVTDYPDEPLAADALKDLVADGRHRDAKALSNEIWKLVGPLARTQVADNLLWWLADLTEKELADPEAARALYDRIYTDYPESGLRDDSRWHAARISRAMGDSKGAADRLRGLLKTRERALFAGSYFSIWLDDAQLLLGIVLRDDLHDPAGAIAAFEKLPKDYPASILRDDALYELAVTHAQQHDAPRSCAAIAKLVKLEPESKYRARADELAASQSCH